MHTNWESSLYHFAHTCMETSWKKWEEGKIGQSWGHTLPARLGYLCNAIVSIVILPFAIIGVLFGLLHGLIKQRADVLKPTWKYLIQQSDELYLGLFGSVVSPALVHWYHKQQNASDANKWLNINVTYIIGTIRGAIYLGGLLYYFG